MLAAVIRSTGDAPALAATFSVLIPAVVAGSLGHAVVVEATRSDDCERVAELTGATYLTAAPEALWPAAGQAARGQWILLLSAGEVPQGDWLGVIERHLMVAPDRPALLPLEGPAGLRERVALALGARQLRPGLIAPARMVAAGRLETAPVRLPTSRRAVG